MKIDFTTALILIVTVFLGTLAALAVAGIYAQNQISQTESTSPVGKLINLL